MENVSYYIVSKQDFTALYRFGKIPLKKEFLIKVEDSISTEDNIINIFRQLPFFQGDEEYLILLVDDTKLINDIVKMSSLLEIYPLTRAAKYSYEMKFNKDLIFKDVPYPHLFDKLNLYFEKEERLLAVEILPEILLSGTDYEVINLDVEIQAFIDFKEKGSKSFDFTSDYLTHLLMYSRYNPFPNIDLGYFYDAGEAFAHSNGIQTFKGSNIHAYLEDKKEELRKEKLSTLISVIEKEKEVTASFKEKTTIGGIKQYLAAVLFLKFKNEIEEHGKLSKSKIPNICNALIERSMHLNELTLAVSLLGAFFGYKAFYDDYYAMSSLPVFREKVNSDITNVVSVMPSKLNEISDQEFPKHDIEEESDKTSLDEPFLIQEIKALSKIYGSHLKTEMLSGVKKAIKKNDNVSISTIPKIKEYLLNNYGEYVSVGTDKLIKFKSVSPQLF